jgi:hypothetical protein
MAKRWAVRGALVVVVVLASLALSGALARRGAFAGGNLDTVAVTVTGSPVSGLTMSPLALSPAFSSATSDYTIRCQSGVNVVALDVDASGPLTVNYPGGSQSGTNVNVPLALVENQAVEVRGPGASDYWIRCLPHDFPDIQVNQAGVGTPGWTPGWYLTGNITTSAAAGSGTYAMILNGNGTPVWYQHAPDGAIGVELTPGAVQGTYSHTLSWAPNLGPGLGAAPDGAFNLLDLDTMASQPLSAWVTPTDPHELFQDAGGNRWMISSPLRYGMNLSPLGLAAVHTIVDCVIQETNPQGNLVWAWRASDHIGVNETNPSLMGLPLIDGQQAADVYHCNSVDIDPINPDHVLLSSRNTAAVYLIDKSTGSVTWKLGGTPYNQSGAQVLSIAGDPEGTFSAQHDARFEPNGDVSLYDDHGALPGPARGVEYHINTNAGSATMDWQLAAPDGLSAAATGSFRCYDGSVSTYDQLGSSFVGSNCAGASSAVVGWGAKQGSGFTEVTADSTKRVLFNVAFPNGEVEYRVLKVPVSALNVSLLRDTAGLPFSGKLPATPVPYPQGLGYWLVASDGGVFAFGDASFFGSMGGHPLSKPMVGMSSTADGNGYWLVASDGGVFAYGDAGFFGSAGGEPLARPVVGMAMTPDGRGYWLAGADGGVFAYGDASFYGSMGGQRLSQPVVGIAATPDGGGYWLVAADGGVFSFGDAAFHGSMGGQRLSRPVAGITASGSGQGYILVAQDGGVFAFGDAVYQGSMGGQVLARPVVGVTGFSQGRSYWLSSADGGVFTFGAAPYAGSMGGRPLAAPVVGMADAG